LRASGVWVSPSATEASGAELPIPLLDAERDLKGLKAIVLRTIHSVMSLQTIQFSMFAILL
jgi:hypothetical protein